MIDIYLFIYTGKNQKVTMPIFRIKLTKDNYLPKNKKELENLEYIIDVVFVIEQALRYNDEEYNNKIKKIQDSYGYLYSYQLSILTSSKDKMPKDIIYLGNYKLKEPVNEYYACMNIQLKLWKNVQDSLIFNYKNNNLNENNRFDENICRKWHEQNKVIYKILCGVLSGDIEVPRDIDIIEEDTLTYVGECNK